MNAYVDRKVLEVLDQAGPVGAMAYGCALSGQDVPFEQVYPIACERARDLGHPVQSRDVALGTFRVWRERGERALRNTHERRACQGWRFVQR